MDTSTLERSPSNRTRHIATRQYRTVEETRRIVTEARVSGASVAAVGRKHGINANLIFAWMKQEDQGVLGGRRAAATPKLLAVTIAPEPTVHVPTPVGRTGAGHVEIGLPDGICLRIVGTVPTEQIEQVLRLLRR